MPWFEAPALDSDQRVPPDGLAGETLSASRLRTDSFLERHGQVPLGLGDRDGQRPEAPAIVVMQGTRDASAASRIR